MKKIKIAVLLMALTLANPGHSQSKSSFDPARSDGAKPSDSFADFVLNRMNPSNTDYGKQIQVDRALAVQMTIESMYFWTAVACVSLSIILYVLWIEERRERLRLEIMCARFLAGYHNQLVSAQRAVSEAIEGHQQLRQLLDAQADSKPKIIEAAAPASQTMFRPGWISAPGESHAFANELNSLRQSLTVREAQVTRLQQQLREEKQKNRPLVAGQPDSGPAEKKRTNASPCGRTTDAGEQRSAN